MKVLVMGGTRFNGLALVRELAKHGHEVTTFNRGVTEAELPGGVRRLYGDRTNREQLTEMMKKEDFDVVQDISGYTRDDVQPLFDAFKGRIGHYIFAGSTVIYAHSDVLPIRETHPLDEGPRQGDYGKNKIAVERWLFGEHRDNGFPATVMSFSMVFGPNNGQEREQRMYTRLLSGRPVLIPGDGSAMGQIGHVEDEARALRMAMMNQNTFGKRYNVTGKDFYTDEGYVDVFAEVVDVEPQKVFIPAQLMDDMWDDKFSLERAQPAPTARPAGSTGPATGGRPQNNISLMNSIIQRLNPQVHRWNQNTIFSIDRMREDFGFEPEYTFRSAVEQTYEWYRREGKQQHNVYDWSFEDRLLDMVKERQPAAVM
jgi:nucleoside-diphosphate-sugar epimerase